MLLEVLYFPSAFMYNYYEHNTSSITKLFVMAVRTDAVTCIIGDSLRNEIATERGFPDNSGMKSYTLPAVNLWMVPLL